jgi:hypothetical protein
MIAPISQLPDSTRVWIYQANRTITLQEAEVIKSTLSEFCQQWAAHGQPMESNFEIRENRFVILLVNEENNAASGCSIDGSVRVMKDLQQQLDIDFFDRTKIPFLVNNQIETFPTAKLKVAFVDGLLNDQSITFNTLAATKAELERNWKLSVEKSWLAKYLPKPALS